MTTLPTTTPAPLTLDQCKALLAAGRTRVRVRDGHGEAGRRVKMYRVCMTGEGPQVWGTYLTWGVGFGGVGRSDEHVGYWKPEDLIDDNDAR